MTAGPTPTWLEKAKQNADVIYSGSETTTTDFTVAMDGRIVEQTITPLYLRPLSILVRPVPSQHKIHPSRSRLENRSFPTSILLLLNLGVPCEMLLQESNLAQA